MSAAQYFDIYSEYPPTPAGLALPAASAETPAVKPAVSHPRDVHMILDSVMFTGRVPLSTWTFSIAIGDKLWVSDRISLYFGKETAIRRFIYQGNLPVNQHRINLDVSVAAYNNYGDVLNATQNMRFYEVGDGAQPRGLFQVEDNWMQLLFKFRLSFADKQTS